jgi:type III secretory pathway component EscV
VQDYDWRNVWNDSATKVEIEQRLDEDLTKAGSLMEITAKGVFFEGISVIIGTPAPVNEALAIAVAEEQTLVAQAKSQEAQAAADEAKAKAQLAVTKAEAAKKEAEIAAYGSIENYLYAQAIERGLNPWRDTIIYGGAKQ